MKTTTMFQYFGKERHVIHGHLSRSEIKDLQAEGWRPERRPEPPEQKNRNGITVEARKNRKRRQGHVRQRKEGRGGRAF